MCFWNPAVSGFAARFADAGEICGVIDRHGEILRDVIRGSYGILKGYEKNRRINT